MSLGMLILLLFFWLGIAIITIRLGCRRFKRIYSKTWYNASSKGPNEEMKWSEIRKLMKRDPLEKSPQLCKLRGCSAKYWSWDAAIVLLTVLFLASALVLLVAESSIVGDFLPSLASDKSESSNSLHWAAFAGVPVFVVSIVAVFYQIRLRARSANRQDWIKSIRHEIGVLISSLPSADASKYSAEKALSEVWPHFCKLELYLNPSERVHRSFLTMVRFMYGIPVTIEDKQVRRKLRIPAYRFDPNVQNMSDGPESWVKWRTKTVRLANALLKQEWEQVKHVK